MMAWCAVLFGGALLTAAFALGGTARTGAFIGGGGGIVLGLLYLVSPAWSLRVEVDDEAIEVTRKGERRFRLAWTEIEKVIASPSTKTCFVDGGTPSHSLLVPGMGATAPYDIVDKEELFDIIVARTPDDRIEEVELLETAGKA